VRDNLRHGSLAKTSMYLHSDDIKRAQRMATVCGVPTLRCSGDHLIAILFPLGGKSSRAVIRL